MADKERLDVLLAVRGLLPSRERARAVIMSGDVYVNGQKADKPGTSYPVDAVVEVREKTVPYVSRGGLKLEKALREFCIDVTGLNVLDGGASTGGFTDCLLRHGASHVWAVDVGYGQFAWSLRNDSRVTCIERFNIRNLTSNDLDSHADMAVLDLSFISLTLVLPVISGVLTANAPVVCLVKPQFEAGKDKVGKNGVIREPSVHCEVLSSFIGAAESAGYGVKALTFSPIKGPKGNREFLAHLVLGEASNPVDISNIVELAHGELL